MRNPKLLFRQAEITDPGSPYNGKQVDILVEDGRIRKIESQLSEEDAQVISLSGAKIAPALFDFQVSSGEPGFEEKETLAETCAAALAGGVGDFMLMPGLKPVVDNRSQVEYLLKLGSTLPLGVHVAGALSVGMKGAEMAELYDMRLGGARAFTDDKSPVENTVLLHLALQYSGISGGLIMVHCDEAQLRLGGKVHEGESATLAGMKGSPAIAEELGVVRCLTLARYHNCPIHLSGISTRKSVELVRAARQEGLQVSCSVYAHHLYFTDSVLGTFDSNYKVWPPLRTEDDRVALLEGLADQTIDLICSDHRPENRETKDVEFDFAAYGMRGLESLFSMVYTLMNSDDYWVKKLAYAPRELLGLPVPSLYPGNEARFFAFRDEEYTFTREMLKGRSQNTPLIGKTLRGKVLGTYTPEGAWYSTT